MIKKLSGNTIKLKRLTSQQQISLNTFSGNSMIIKIFNIFLSQFVLNNYFHQNSTSKNYL